MALATLSIDILAKLASFEQGMDKAARIAQKAADQVQQRWDRLGKGVAAVGGALGTVLGTAALATIGRDIINGLDALNDLKDATGASIENLSALEDVALRTGTSMDTVGAAVLKLNKFLADAEPGSAQANMLKQIGLEATELRRVDPAEALRQVAVALSQFEDNGNKARFTQELLGKSIKDVAPLLNDLAEKTTLVGTVSAAQAAEAEKFNKQIAQMEKNVLDAKRALANELLPTLNQFIERARGIGAGGGFFASIGKEIKANLLTEDLNAAVRDLELVEKRITFGETGLDRRRGALRNYIADVQRQLLKATDDIKGFADTAAPVPQRGRPANEGGGKILFSNSLPAAPAKPTDKPTTAPVDSAAKAYESLISKIEQRQALAIIELQTGEKATEAERLRVEVLKDLAKAQALDTDPARAAAKGVQVRAAIDAAAAVLQTADAQRELQKNLRETARIEADQVARLSAEAERRAGINQQLRDQYQLYGLTAEQIDAVQTLRMEEALAIERQNLAMAQNAEASAADITERERIIRLLEQEIALRTAMAERARLDATDPLRGATRALADYQAEIARTGDSTYRLLRTGIDGFEDRTAEMLTRGKADWRSYFASIAIEAAKVNLVRPGLSTLFNLGLNLLTGGATASLTGATGFGDYNAVAAIAAGRAYGGPFGPGEMRPVAERGLPEVVDTPDGTWLITGSKGGQVRALGKGGSGVRTSAPQLSVTVVNTGAPLQVTDQQRMSDTDITVMVQTAAAQARQGAVADVREQIRQPNGGVRRDMAAQFRLQRA